MTFDDYFLCNLRDQHVIIFVMNYKNNKKAV